MYFISDEVTSWGVTDDIYWPSNPQVFLGCGVPSMSSMKSQIAAREMMESVAGRLKRYGFTGFCNIEYFAFEDGSIKVSSHWKLTNCNLTPRKTRNPIT